MVGESEATTSEEREVQKNENELKERKQSLDKEEQERENQTPLIYKVDPFLKDVQAGPFVPAVISLGLFERTTWNNFEDATVKREDLKLDVAIKFMADIGKELSGGWVEVSGKIAKDPTMMKNHYDKLSHHNGHDSKFIQSSDAIQSALALDAIFVTSFLLYLGGRIKFREDKDNERNDKLHSIVVLKLKHVMQLLSRESTKFMNALCGDIFKLENQIPLELLRNTIEIIFASVEEPQQQGYNADQIFEMFCENIVVSLRMSCFPSFVIQKISRDGSPKFRNCGHLLHCLAQAMWEKAEVELHPNASDISDGSDSGSSRIEDGMEDAFNESDTNLHLVTASELQKCGVTIKAQKAFFPKLEPDRYFWWRATLYLPQIHILHEYSELYWKNFIAFEGPYISEKNMALSEESFAETSFLQYLTFMNELINTKEDVVLFCTGKDPIIRSNQLGDYETVADLFNSLTSRQNNTMGKKWRSIRSQIMQYHNRTYRVKIVEFLDKYFGKPWLVISLIVASILLVSTCVQTVFSVLRYYKDSEHAHGPILRHYMA